MAFVVELGMTQEFGILLGAETEINALAAIDSSLRTSGAVGLTDQPELWRAFTSFVAERGRDYYLTTDDVAFVAEISRQKIAIVCTNRRDFFEPRVYLPIAQGRGLCRTIDGASEQFHVIEGVFRDPQDQMKVVAHNGRVHYEATVDAQVSGNRNGRPTEPKQARPKAVREKAAGAEAWAWA
jgi:hypothetical protein